MRSSVTVRAPSLCPRVKRHLFLCVFADVDLDAVVSSAEKLSHPTASRPRVTDRRPRSQIITSVRFVELLVTCKIEEQNITLYVCVSFSLPCPLPSWTPLQWRTGGRRTEARRSRSLSPDLSTRPRGKEFLPSPYDHPRCTSSHYLFLPGEDTTSQIFMFLSSVQTPESSQSVTACCSLLQVELLDDDISHC